jgi:hypothetical protein
VVQVAVPNGTRLIGRLQADPERVTDALRLGAKAMASALLRDAVDLCWQPVVYRATPTEEAVAQPLRGTVVRRLLAGSRAGANG